MWNAAPNLVARFNLKATAALAVRAAFDNMLKRHGTDGWTAEVFAKNLAGWLVEEKLMPAHVAPFDFQQAVIAEVNRCAGTARSE